MDAEKFCGFATLTVDVFQRGFDQRRFDGTLQSYEQFAGCSVGVFQLCFSPCSYCGRKLIIDRLGGRGSMLRK